MKYLTDYVQAKQTELIKRFECYFAFSKEQYEEQRTEGENYTSVGGGLIVRRGNEDAVSKGLSDIRAEGIKEDIAENGIEAIIRRELNNHEVCYTQDISDTVDSLEGYGVSAEQVMAVYRNVERTGE